MTRKKDDELTPEQQQLIARVKRLMALPLLVMVAGFLTVFGVIGYRLYFKTPAPASPTLEKTLQLPRGAKVISTAINEGKLVVTVELGGLVEVLLYDLDNLQPRGRFTIRTAP
jgi:hypothetical protein